MRRHKSNKLFNSTQSSGCCVCLQAVRDETRNSINAAQDGDAGTALETQASAEAEFSAFATGMRK